MMGDGVLWFIPKEGPDGGVTSLNLSYFP
jgi:hypothetical protein